MPHLLLRVRVFGIGSGRSGWGVDRSRSSGSSSDGSLGGGRLVCSIHGRDRLVLVLESLLQAIDASEEGLENVGLRTTLLRYGVYWVCRLVHHIVGVRDGFGKLTIYARNLEHLTSLAGRFDTVTFDLGKAQCQ